MCGPQRWSLTPWWLILSFNLYRNKKWIKSCICFYQRSSVVKLWLQSKCQCSAGGSAEKQKTESLGTSQQLWPVASTWLSPSGKHYMLAKWTKKNEKPGLVERWERKCISKGNKRGERKLPSWEENIRSPQSPGKRNKPIAFLGTSPHYSHPHSCHFSSSTCHTYSGSALLTKLKALVTACKSLTYQPDLLIWPYPPLFFLHFHFSSQLRLLTFP